MFEATCGIFLTRKQLLAVIESVDADISRERMKDRRSTRLQPLEAARKKMLHAYYIDFEK